MRAYLCIHDVVEFACRWCCSISERLVLDSALDEVFKVRENVAALLPAPSPCSAGKRVGPTLGALHKCHTLSSTSKRGHSGSAQSGFFQMNLSMVSPAVHGMAGLGGPAC